MSKKTFSSKYINYIQSDSWRKKARFCRKMTNFRCCVLPIFPAHDTHHLHYKNLGNEIIFRDIVPLSKGIHKLIHFFLDVKILKKMKIKIIINTLLRILFLINVMLCFIIKLFIKILF